MYVKCGKRSKSAMLSWVARDQAVDANDWLFLPRQSFAEVRSEKASAAGYQRCHMSGYLS